MSFLIYFFKVQPGIKVGIVAELFMRLLSPLANLIGQNAIEFPKLIGRVGFHLSSLVSSDVPRAV